MAAWRHMEARRCRMHVVTVRRRGGQLVAVWPLRVRREGCLRVASHIGRGSDEEYAGPLIAPGPWSGEIARTALDGVRGAADLVTAFNVHPENPICEVLEEVRGRRRDATPVQIAGTGAHPDMTGWLASRTRKFRRNLAQSRHRLGTLGQTQVRIIAAPQEAPDFVDWLFLHKLAYLDTLGIGRSWLRTPGASGMFKDLLCVDPARGGALGFELTVDGRRAAAAVALPGARLELAITTYDPAYAAGSPGASVLALAAETAIARGLDLDFRFGDEAYKAWWADRVETRWNYAAPLTPLGVAGVAAIRSVAAARGLRRRIGPPIKRLLRA